MSRRETLDDLRNYLYLRAEILWEISVTLAVSTVLLSIIALANQNAVWLGLIGVLALLIPVAIAWIREAATTEQLRADKCRRMILIADGLGRTIPSSELAEVRAWSVGTQLSAAPFIPPFYTSSRPAGPQRLADITTESAFFTEHLARKLESALRVLFAVLLICAIVVLHLAELAAGQTAAGLAFAGKSIAVFISFLISGDFWLLAKKYGELREQAHDVYRRSAELRDNSEATADEVRDAVEDYGITLIQCPPIPHWLYRLYRDRLNAIYRDSHRVN